MKKLLSYILKNVEESKPITIYLKEHAETGIIKSYDNYVKSIDDVEYIAYSETIPYFIINADEEYNDIVASAYLSDTGKWNDMELRYVGKGQYIMDIIKTEKDEDRTITCCIKANNEEGNIETYFSYKASKQEEGIIVPFM